jgi:hypothetical protein
MRFIQIPQISGELIQGDCASRILANLIETTKDFFNREMRRKKKTTIVTFESRERMTIHRGQRGLIAWCNRCCGEVLMVTPNEAAASSGINARAIFRGIEAGEIHFFENEGGALLVCSKSLPWGRAGQ